MKYRDDTYNGKCQACRDLVKVCGGKVYACPYCRIHKEHKKDCKCKECKSETTNTETK